MTQPPDESEASPPDEGWQPPGPATPPQPPPQNPYGAGPTSNYQPGYDQPGYYQPSDSGGMSSTVKVVLGLVIGVFVGFVLWFVAVIAFSAGGTGDGTGFLFFAAVAPLVVPAPLLIWRATRPWAAGLLMGTAISSIGMSGLCASLLSSW
jgi:hypothetical protein